MKKTFVRATALIIASALFLLPFSSLNNLQAASLYDQRNNLKQQVSDSKTKSETQKQQAAQLEKDAKALDGQINYLSNKISQTATQVSEANTKVQDSIQKIKTEEQNLAQAKKKLGGILSDWYMKGNPSFSEVIISSGSLSQFIDQSEYYEALQTQVADEIGKVKTLKIALENTKKEQEKQLADLKDLQNTQQIQKRSLASSQSNKEQLAQTASALSSKYAKDADAASTQLAQVEGEIRNAELAAAQRFNNGNGAVWTRDGRSTQGFIWPLIGEFRAGFGYSSAYFAGMFHTGIDIGNSPLSSIKAAKAGTVVETRDGLGNTYPRSKSYGNYVKIRHEGGVYTLYGHLESGTVNVSNGQSVEQGQVVGLEGNSGFSTGYHLHFELRGPDDIAIDPAPYLP